MAGLVGPLFATTWHMLQLQRESLERLFDFETRSKVGLLADGLEGPVWNLIPDQGRSLVQSVMADPVFLSVTVTTPNGVFLEAREGDARAVDRRALSAPIVHRGEEIGEVSVEVDRSGVDARIERHSQEVYAIGGVQLVVSLAVVAFVVAAARRAERVEVLREHNQRLADEIAERKRAQEALEAARDEAETSRARLDDAVHSIGHAFAIFDAERRLLAWNPSYAALFDGQPAAPREGAAFDDLGRVLLASGHVEDRGPSADGDGDLLAALGGRGAPVELRTARGAWIQVSTHGTGRGGLAQLGTDVTELKRAQEALAVRERHLELIADTLPVLVSHIDRERRYLYVNRPRAEALRERPEAIVGRTVAEVRGVGRMAVIGRHLDAVMSGRRQEFESDVTMPGDGTRTLRSLFVPELDADGAVVGAFLFAEDVTAQRAIEGQLRRSQKMEAVGQLTGGIAHDFNNLLQVITLNLEILDSELEARGDLHDMVRTAQESARRGAELTRQLLAFSRQQMLDARVVDVTEFVSRTERLLRRTLGETIEIRTEMDPATWPVQVDPTFLESALVNLAVNARDAMPEGGRLLVRTANVRLEAGDEVDEPELVPGPYVLLEVADTGCGMPRHVVERAFDPFFTTKEVGQGTGLGLSMVYGFVKQSRGHVRIHSEPGRGTSVKMYLPRAHGAAAATVAEPAALVPLPDGREHVLVVEDDPDVRRASVMQLERLGYAVTTAEDGPGALAVLADDPSIDLLFSDVVLPSGMTGIQLAGRARTLRPGLRVLLCSGYPRSAMGDGEAYDIIAKPYRRQELAQRVRAALDGAG